MVITVAEQGSDQAAIEKLLEEEKLRLKPVVRAIEGYMENIEYLFSDLESYRGMTPSVHAKLARREANKLRRVFTKRASEAISVGLLYHLEPVGNSQHGFWKMLGTKISDSMYQILDDRAFAEAGAFAGNKLPLPTNEDSDEDTKAKINALEEAVDKLMEDKELQEYDLPFEI